MRLETDSRVAPPPLASALPVSFSIFTEPSLNLRGLILIVSSAEPFDADKIIFLWTKLLKLQVDIG
jgi:hypothetical protein